MRSAAEELADLAARKPNDILMTYLDDGVAFTNREMYEQVRSWAAAYTKTGVRSGSAVAVMMPACPDAYFAWLGVAWVRGLEVPINTDYRGSMLVHVVNSSGAEIAVVSKQYVSRFIEVAEKLLTLKTLVVPDDVSAEQHSRFVTVARNEFLADAPPATELSPPGGNDIAAVVYTSGTTGPSKGVVIPWESLSTYTLSLGPATGRAFRMYSAWPIFHSSGKFALTETIRRSGTLFLRQRWRTEQFWADIRACGATATGFLGGISNFIWSQPERPDDAANPLEDVLMAPVIPQFRQFERRFGLRIHTGFATSEVGMPISCCHPMPNHRTCGRVLPGYEVRVVDADGKEAGPNTVGEALVRSDDPDRMCRGYLNMPEKSAEAWAGGWFHTGDGLMFDDDGNYYYVDRIKDCIRRRGENISSFGVENEVNAHPGVAESAAVEVKGEDDDGEVMIFVVRRPDATVTEGELLEFLIPRMPRFMVPRFIEFVPSLPKTHSHRTRKIELRDRGRTPTTWDRLAAGIVIPR